MQQQPKEPAPDQGSDSQDDVSHVDLDQSPDEVLEYWTEERMAEAKPREIRLPKPGPRPGDQD
ncbi:hypothetical protein [Arthrobacter sp. MAHUQ-56]